MTIAVGRPRCTCQGTCVFACRESGGITNKNIILATVCGIVVHENKNLLAKNGGSVNVNKGWTNSFIARHGFLENAEQLKLLGKYWLI